MIERIRLAVFFMAIISPLFVSNNAIAQKRAEFELQLTLTDTEQHGQIDSIGGRYLGFDSAATDGLDPAFGESDYPGGTGPGVNDFYFSINDPDQDISIIDIRHKPSVDSFSLDYQMTMSIENPVGSIYWNPSQIPAAVTGIWIRPYYSQTPIMDMKNNRIFTFTADSLITWGPYLVVTVFYNMQPRYVPSAGVESGQANNGELIANASVFPNPVTSDGKLDVSLNEPAYLSITGCDVAGRELMKMSRPASSGDNMIDLQSLAGVHGAVFLRIAAQSESGSDVKNIVVMKE